MVVNGVSRAFSQAEAESIQYLPERLGSLNALQNYTNQIDNLLGTTAGGLTTALQTYYSGWSNVANDPTSTAARQALLGDAQSSGSSFQGTAPSSTRSNADVNTRISADVTQINSIAQSIGQLNQQIVSSTAGGQSPNTLLDQRDQLVCNLSQLVGVTTTTDSNGGLNVFIGYGEPLVAAA